MYGPITSVVAAGLAGLTMASCACGQSEASPSPSGLAIQPWFVYKSEDSIDLLRPQADIIDTISVCGGPPRRFVDQCHELGIRVHLLVGGHDGSSFDTPEHRAETIRKWLHLCGAVGFDGIDLDYEGLDPECKDSYSRLLRELRGAGKHMSMCVSYVMSTRRTIEGTPPGIAGIDWCDPIVVGQTCDSVRVMCYDMYSVSGKGIGPVSTRPWAEDAMRFWMRYLPRDKLVMDLPAYARDYALVLNGKVRSFYAPRPPLLEGTRVQRVWLPYEEINTLRYVDADGVYHLFFASDETSTRAHLRTVTELGIGALAFWHYSAVTPEMWAAVRAWLEEPRAGVDGGG